MGITVGVEIYDIGQLIQLINKANIEQHAEEIDKDFLRNEILPKFGKEVHGMLICLYAENFDIYNPASELREFIARYYDLVEVKCSIPDDASISGNYRGKCWGGVNSDDVADKLGVELHKSRCKND